MRSIKPGRGPSFQSGISSVFAVLFGLLWTLMAAQSGAPIFFTLFGVLFMLLAISNAIYHFRNAKKKNRDSLYDITDSAFEEREGTHDAFVPTPEAHYCPYCGTPLVDGARYCQNCGQKIR